MDEIFEPVEIEKDSVQSVIEHFARISVADASDFVFRGHREHEWGLTASIDRFASGVVHAEAAGNDNRQSAMAYLLERFRKHYVALTGRQIDDDQHLLQVAQHYGLPTTLLDVTDSPFIGLFFALQGMSLEDEDSMACVWQFNVQLLRSLNVEVSRFLDSLDSRDLLHRMLGPIEYVRAVPKFNPRLHTQQGGFLRWKYFCDLRVAMKYWKSTDALVHTVCATPVLTKLTFPVHGRQAVRALAKLRQMNVCPQVLFPDARGAAEQAQADFVGRAFDSDRRTYHFQLPTGK